MCYKEHPSSITATDQLIQLKEYFFDWENLLPLRFQLELNAKAYMEVCGDPRDAAYSPASMMHGQTG